MWWARLAAPFFVVCGLLGCASAQTRNNPEHKGVHSGQREKIEFFDSVLPICEIEGYPEIRVVRAPHHGSVTFAQGQDYPSFSKDNVRWECNRKLLGSTQVFYESAPGFHGKDSVSIEVRFPSAGIRTVDIDITVL